MTGVKFILLHSNTWNHLTVCKKKMSSNSFKNVINKMYLQIIYLIYLYKQHIALNNLQWLICNKTKPNQAKYQHIARELKRYGTWKW